MDLEIDFGASLNGEEEARSLLAWLRQEDGLSECVSELKAAPTAPDQMGAVSEALVVALGAGGSGAVLARSLTFWLRTRRANIKMKIKTSQGTYEVTGEHLRDPDRLVREIRGLIDEDR